MKYFKSLVLSLKETLGVMLLQYFILILVILALGMEKAIIVGSIILVIFEGSYILFKLKDMDISFTNKSFFPYILLGTSLAVIYNMVIFKLNNNLEVNYEFPIILNIICSGIIGPIFEEVLFRYSLINKLEKFNSKWMVIILSSLIFAVSHTNIIHTNMITIIYAMIIGLVNAFLYIKDKNIIIPIMLHMAANIIVNLLLGYNIWILGLGIILLIVSILIIRKEN